MADSGIVARRAGIVALGTLASRILGMLREAVVAAVFPVASTDAFFIAFTIPNTLRMLLGEGAVSNAFIPVFTDVRTRQGPDAAKAFLARFSAALGLLLLLTSLAGMVFARPLSVAYAGGFIGDPERFELVVWLTRWMFPFLGLAGLAALATGALNAVGHFAVAAFAPALLNVAMIAAPFTLLPLSTAWGLDPIASLAIGALLGGLLQLVAQLLPAAQAALLPRPRARPQAPRRAPRPLADGSTRARARRVSAQHAALAPVCLVPARRRPELPQLRTARDRSAARHVRPGRGFGSPTHPLAPAQRRQKRASCSRSFATLCASRCSSRCPPACS